MSVGRFLISKVFYRQLLISIGVALALLFIAWQGLAIFTRHGNHIAVPDYTGMTPDEIMLFHLDKGLEFIILDSVYDSQRVPGTIVMQDPLPNSLVKEGRKVYLTKVAILPEQVAMPDLVDLTFRQAISTLETYGLRIGKLEYVPDIARNAVLQQLHEGQIIEPGTYIIKSSSVDLVIGRGLGNEQIPVPFLLGLTKEEAHQLITASYLNPGANIFECEADSNARVYKQSPAWSADAFLKMGEQVDLWYRSALEFDFDSLLQMYLPDSTMIYDSLYFDPNF